MKKPPRARVFFISVRPYQKTLCVAAGCKNMAEIRRRMGKIDKWFADWLDERTKLLDGLIANETAFCAVHWRGAGLIHLRPYKNGWDFWDTLMHEVFHYVDDISNQMSFEDEKEAKAYLHEDLFRQIRRRLACP